MKTRFVNWAFPTDLFAAKSGWAMPNLPEFLPQLFHRQQILSVLPDPTCLAKSGESIFSIVREPIGE